MPTDPICKFTVNRNEVEAMRLLVSRDNKRAGMCGIRFEIIPERILMIATDGRRLGVLIAEHKDATASHVFTASCKAISLLPESNSPSVNVEVFPEKISFAAENVVATEDLIPMAFLAWRDVIQIDSPQPYEMYLNGDYVEGFRQIAIALTNGNSNAIHLLSHSSPLNPVSVVIPNCEFYGVVMQMRYEGPILIPDWVENLKTEKPPTAKKP